MITQVCVIGAGPAGLMASIQSTLAGADTVILEANQIPGRKLLMTGGGRCNFTHDVSAREMARQVDHGGRFLQYCLHEFPPREIMDIFNQWGLPCKVEAGQCVFPKSDRADDVSNVLTKMAKKVNVSVIYNQKVWHITKNKYERFQITTSRDEFIEAQSVIIATGGKSWPKTGSTGEGYNFAKALGHNIIKPRPALVPLVTRENWPGMIAGTAIEKVKINCHVGPQKYAAQGSMLFTHKGIGGPAVLDISRYLTEHLPNSKAILITIDLFSNMSFAALEEELIGLFESNPKKTLLGVMKLLIPNRLADVLLGEFGFDSNSRISQLKKQNRKNLVSLLKAIPLKILSTEPLAKATITRGGVSTDQIEAKTMESKICSGLYFAGEIIDADGPCGGYNLQICWSTASVAGLAAAKKCGK
jgi:predicted Rossmann fold flavoprotein